ncbi:hypothetical protein [Flavobacterium chungangensis]|uniref:Uncharacterized protein n=1 Tax=Flavobacterium chungangensis TaxID=2708132 RepID=A0ABV8ZCJ7_9FLAO
MNSVKIHVAKDQNNINNLLINGDALDLFETEQIPYTMKVTDLQDIGSNYANFTKDFIIPASSRNNIILKYWFDIKNDNQFKTSEPIPARIDIGGAFFSLGNLKIITFSTDETGSPKTYSVTFTGSLSNLKTQFGDLQLSDLPIANIVGSDVISFEDINVVASINNTTAYRPLEIPLIPINRSIANYDTIKYSSTVKNPNGFKRSELRPALKFKTIFQAIENKFSVNFSGPFVASNLLDRLYIWLNKNETLFNSGGVIVDLFDSPPVIANTFEYHPNPNITVKNLGYVTLKKPTTYKKLALTYEVTGVSNNTVPYRGKIQEVVLKPDGTIDETLTAEQPNFGIVSTAEFGTGGRSVQLIINYENTPTLPIGYKRSFRFIAETEGSNTVVITSYRILVQAGGGGGLPGTRVFNPTSGKIVKNEALISANLPELKLQDFLTSLIKMFNLVIIPNGNNSYVIDFYTNYYANGKKIDITKYCTPTKKINRVKTYKEIVFKHEDSEYNENKLYKSYQNPIREFGSVTQKFTDGDIDSFKVESKFGIMIFKQLEGMNYTVETTFKNHYIIGAGAGSDNSIVTNKPTIFFCNGKAEILDNKRAAYVLDDTTNVALNTYTLFSNIDDAFNYTTSLCFSNESMFGYLYDKNLYTNNYQNLMISVSSPYAREFEIEAYLPRHIFTTVSLNNRLIIGNEIFSISEISIDLLTGKSKLKINNLIK